MSEMAPSTPLADVPSAAGSQVRFRVVIPDHHPIAVTVRAALATATALAVARHHPDHYSLIVASDGRRLQVDRGGNTRLGPEMDREGWPETVQETLEQLAEPKPSSAVATR